MSPLLLMRTRIVFIAVAILALISAPAAFNTLPYAAAQQQEFSGEWQQSESGCWTIVLADNRQLTPQPVAGVDLFPELPRVGASHFFTGEISPEIPAQCAGTTVVISESRTEYIPPPAPKDPSSGGVISAVSAFIPLIGLFSLILVTLLVVANDESVQFAALKRASGRGARTAEAIFLRGRILGFLSANEGLHFSGISEAFSMGNHQTAHHLSQLEDEGHIWSRRDGRKLRFYTSVIDARTGSLPTPIDLPSLESIPARIMVDLQSVETGHFVGTKQSQIAGRIGASQQLVSHHLKGLQKCGWVMTQGRGRKKKLRLTFSGIEALDRIHHDDEQPPVEASFSPTYEEIAG